MEIVTNIHIEVQNQDNLTRYLLIGLYLSEKTVSGRTPVAWREEPSTTAARMTCTLIRTGEWMMKLMSLLARFGAVEHVEQLLEPSNSGVRVLPLELEVAISKEWGVSLGKGRRD